MSGTGISPNFQRARILYQQRRYADAERELRIAVGSDPDNAEIHAILALCLAVLKRLPEAMAEAEMAVGLSPDQPFMHYVMAHVLMDRNRPEEALAVVQQALSLNSQNPTYLSLLSEIDFSLRQWPAALDAAERGLAIDPEHEQCVNLRAMALVKLGRRAEAGAAIGAALARNPEDATAHANQGWTCLHQGDHRAAMIHFREALRLKPELEWARAGMVESLKARNPIYKVMLAYFLFMGRLGRRAQWGIFIGGYVGVQVLKGVSRDNPSVTPYILPLILLYAVFAIMTWIASPLFNLLLRLDRFGKYALSSEQKWGANCTGLVLLIPLTLGGMAWAWGSTELLYLALGGLLYLIPVAAIFNAPQGWPKYALATYAGALGILLGAFMWGVVPAVIRNTPEPDWTYSVAMSYVWGVLLNQVVANALFGVRVRK